MNKHIFIFHFSLLLGGVFGVDADEVKSVSVMEGDAVILHRDETDIQTNVFIVWKFGPRGILIAQFDRKNDKRKIFNDNADGRFRDRLKLDQTGSLTITNARTTDSGLYKVTSTKKTPHNTFSLTVYAPLPIPVITRDSSQCPSSSLSSSCSLLCSVVNVSHVTLSWFKGNSVLSSISVSHLTSSVSLHMEVDHQDKNTYSCVLNNPIRNHTTHLDISQLCQPCADHPAIIPQNPSSSERDAGVFGVDGVVSVSVMEGDSVTLNIDLTQLQGDDIMWRFERYLIAKIIRRKNSIYDDSADGRFRDRLQLDQTGSLSITNTTTSDSGLYKVTSSRRKMPLNTFNLTVYAPLPIPVITTDSSQCPSSSSHQNCSLLCSVVNVSHVTLSWFKGNSVLSSISVSDLSISLSLPLEVDYQDKNTYSCVLHNPIRNHTTHLDISGLCQTCAGI